jgi:hypothetical protein
MSDPSRGTVLDEHLVDGFAPRGRAVYTGAGKGNVYLDSVGDVSSATPLLAPHGFKIVRFIYGHYFVFSLAHETVPGTQGSPEKKLLFGCWRYNEASTEHKADWSTPTYAVDAAFLRSELVRVLGLFALLLSPKWLSCH